MGTTGTQFFLQDAEEGRATLLVRRAFLHNHVWTCANHAGLPSHHERLFVQEMMTQDDPDDGYYLSALKSFVTRTCYANSSGVQPTRPCTYNVAFRGMWLLFKDVH